MMTWWKRFARQTGVQAFFPRRPAGHVALHEALASAQRQRRGEDYAAALAELERAAQIASLVDDAAAARTVIDLQRAEIFTLQGRWKDAENLLLHMRRAAQTEFNRAQMAYALGALGALAWAQGEREEARAYYEQAATAAQAAGSPGAEGRAQAYLADTYLAEGNASYAVHLLKDGLPRLNMGGDLDTLAHYVGRLGEALIASGQDAEGERLLYRALRLAERLRDRANERRWALALAARDLHAQRFDDAQKHYRQALAAFAPAAQSGADYASALCYLSRVCLRSGAAAEALERAQAAARLAAAHEDAALDALAGATLGLALHAAGDSAAAIPHLARAAARFREQNSADAFQIDALRGLAAARQRVEGDEAAAADYADAVRRAGEIGAPLKFARAHLDLGLLRLNAGQVPAAVEAWRAALAVYENDRRAALAARVRCDIAGAYRYLGQGQRALKEYEQALVDLNSADDPVTRGLVLANAAVAYADQGDLQTADAFFTEAITIAVSSGDRAAEAARRGNYGWFKWAVGRPREAVALLEHALSISREQRLPLAAAVQTDNLGLAHGALGNDSAALSCHEQALEMARALHNAHWEAVIGTNLAAALLAAGRRDEAAALLLAALAQRRAADDAEALVRALTGQARLLLSAGQPGEAGALLGEAVALARRAGMRRLLADALRAHSEQQAAVGSPAAARALWDEARRLFTMFGAPPAPPEPAWLDRAGVEA